MEGNFAGQGGCNKKMPGNKERGEGVRKSDGDYKKTGLSDSGDGSGNR